MRAVPQFAYHVDPWTTPIRTPGFLSGREISGLSELVALPRGRPPRLGARPMRRQGRERKPAEPSLPVDPTERPDVSREPFRGAWLGGATRPRERSSSGRRIGAHELQLRGMTLGRRWRTGAGSSSSSPTTTRERASRSSRSGSSRATLRYHRSACPRPARDLLLFSGVGAAPSSCSWCIRAGRSGRTGRGCRGRFRRERSPRRWPHPGRARRDVLPERPARMHQEQLDGAAPTPKQEESRAGLGRAGTMIAERQAREEPDREERLARSRVVVRRRGQEPAPVRQLRPRVIPSKLEFVSPQFSFSQRRDLSRGRVAPPNQAPRNGSRDTSVAPVGSTR